MSGFGFIVYATCPACGSPRAFRLKRPVGAIACHRCRKVAVPRHPP